MIRATFCYLTSSLSLRYALRVDLLFLCKKRHAQPVSWKDTVEDGPYFRSKGRYTSTLAASAHGDLLCRVDWRLVTQLLDLPLHAARSEVFTVFRRESLDLSWMLIRSYSRYSTLRASVTAVTSSVDVRPAITFVHPYSRSGTMPSCPATVWSAEAWWPVAIISCNRVETIQISKIATRP